MTTTLTPMRETASQTAGPYVHIGLAPKAAGFDIFENNFGNVLATPATKGERILIEGRVFDGSDTPVRIAALGGYALALFGRIGPGLPVAGLGRCWCSREGVMARLTVPRHARHRPSGAGEGGTRRSRGWPVSRRCRSSLAR